MAADEIYFSNLAAKRDIMLRTLLVLMPIILFACSSAETTPSEIYGSWEKQQWIIDQTRKEVNSKMDFIFNEDGTYQIDYGSQKENGIFNIEGERLYTTETGQARKYVKIIRLTPDTLEFQMNRAGQIETVLLAKGK